MKKLLLIIVGVVFFTACSSQDDMSHKEIKSSVPTFVNPYLFIGQLHNDAMDSVKAQKINIENIKEFTNEFTNRHYQQKSDFNEKPHFERRCLCIWNWRFVL